MNSGIGCFKQNKRKSPIIECDKPARCARVLLERLPSKSDKYLEKDKIKLNKLNIISEKRFLEEKVTSETTNSTDNQPICKNVNEQTLKNLKKYSVNFKHEEIKNSSDTGKSKRKKIKPSVDSTKIDEKINLSPIVLLEKFSIEKLKQIYNINGESSKLNNTSHSDFSLIQASSQSNAEEEIKELKKPHLEDKSVNSDAETQNKQLCIESQLKNNLAKNKNNISVQDPKLSSISIETSNTKIEEKLCDPEKTNVKQKFKDKITSKSLKNININKTQVSSSHFITEDNSLTTDKVPCRQKLRTKRKKLVLSNDLPGKKAILDDAVCKDKSVVKWHVKHKRKFRNGLVETGDSDKILLQDTVDTENSLPKSRLNSKPFELEKKCIEQNVLINVDKCSFQKTESKPESKSQTIKYPKLCIKRISPSDLNRNLNKSENLLVEKKSKSEINQSETVEKEISNKDKSSEKLFNDEVFEHSEQNSSEKDENKQILFENEPLQNSIEKIVCEEPNLSSIFSSEKCITDTQENIQELNSKLTDSQKSSLFDNLELSNSRGNERDGGNFVQCENMLEEKLLSLKDKIQNNQDLNRDFSQEQKLSSSCNNGNKFISKKRSRNKRKLNNKNRKKSKMQNRKKLSNNRKIEGSGPNEQLCEEKIIDNNNIQKLAYSCGGSNQESDEKSSLLDSKKSTTENKCTSRKILEVESSVVSEKKLIINKGVLEKPDESFELLLSTNFESKKKFFENIKNTGESPKLFQKTCEVKNISNHSVDQENLVSDTHVNINNFQIFSKLTGLKTSSLDNDKIVIEQNSLSDDTFGRNNSSNQQKLTQTCLYFSKESDRCDKFNLDNAKKNDLTEDISQKSNETESRITFTNKVLENTKTNSSESSDNTEKEQKSILEKVKNHHIFNKQEFLNETLFTDKIDCNNKIIDQRGSVEAVKIIGSRCERDFSNNSVVNTDLIDKHKNKNNVSSEINIEEISNDSVIEEESIETDEIQDEEDFSNDSVENKKIYVESEFDSDMDEKKHLDDHETTLSEPKITLVSTEKFEMHLEQEISNDSAMDDKLTECKKIALDEELIINTEIYLEQEILSSDSGTEEKKSVNNDTSTSEEESLGESNKNYIMNLKQPLSNNSDDLNNLSKSDKTENGLENFSIRNRESKINNFSFSEKSIENMEIYMEQEISKNSDELTVENEGDSKNQSTIDEVIHIDNQPKVDEIIHVKDQPLNEEKTHIVEECISDVINAVVENIHNVRENKNKLPHEQKLAENRHKEEILKDIVANEHSYFKEEIDVVSDTNNGIKLDISSNNIKSRNLFNPQASPPIPYSLQEKESNSTIIDDCQVDRFSKNTVIENCLTEIIENSKKSSADMNVVEKIKSRLNNLKETCDLAFRNVTDIIRDCSSIIEKDLNELKKRRENENITNEKLLVINLDESKDTKKMGSSFNSEEYFGGTKIIEKNQHNFNDDDMIHEEFLLNPKYNPGSFTGCTEYVIDPSCSNEIDLEDVKLDIEINEEIDEVESPSGVTKHQNDLLKKCSVDKRMSSNYHETFHSPIDININKFNNPKQKIYNDHTYAECVYVQNSDEEVTDHEECTKVISPMSKFSRARNTNKGKNSTSVTPVIGIANSEDDVKMEEIVIENKIGGEKDATTSLKEICKKIAARINPGNSNENTAKDPLELDSRPENRSNKISDLLYISGSDEEDKLAKTVQQRNKEQSFHRFSRIEKANISKFIQKEVVSNSRISHETSLLKPVSFIDDADTFENNHYNVPMKCPKCDGIYFGYLRMKKHIAICGEEPNLSCPWCSRKLKYRQSLVKHFLKFHSNAVKPKEAHKIADKVASDARKMSKRSKSTSTLSTSGLSTLGHMPDFLKLYCSKCKLLVDWEPNNTRICTDCSQPMSINCQNCERYDVQYNQVNYHFKGQCAPVRASTNLNCSRCPFRAVEKYKLYDHMMTKHSIHLTRDSGEICTKGCNRRFTVRTARLRHERHCGKEPDRFCKFCPFKSKHRSAIKVHIQQHVLNGDTGRGNDILYEDEDVDIQNSIEAQISGKNKSEYENRIRSRMTASCIKCKKSVKITDTNNLCDCGRVLEFSCNICNMKKSAYHPIRVHVIRRHLEKPFKCHVCWRLYSYFPDYKNHVSKCGQEPERRCGHCSFRCFSIKSLDLHKRKMHGTRSRLPTCLKCGKTFTLNRTLARHEERYCGVEAKFACEHCPFMTRSKFSLKRHLQSIHYKIFTNVRFECGNCLKEFNSLYSRDIHSKTCTVVWTEET